MRVAPEQRTRPAAPLHLPPAPTKRGLDVTAHGLVERREVGCLGGGGWRELYTGRRPVRPVQGALAMTATGCLSWDEARRAVDVPVLLVVAAALGLGSAIESTGLAGVLDSGLTQVTVGLGQIAVMAGV